MPRIWVQSWKPAAPIASARFDLGDRRVDIVQRQRGGESGKTVVIAGDQLGEAIIHQPHQVDRERAVRQILNRRHRGRQQLPIAGETIHQAETVIKVVKRFQLKPALERPAADAMV